MAPLSEAHAQTSESIDQDWSWSGFIYRNGADRTGETVQNTPQPTDAKTPLQPPVVVPKPASLMTVYLLVITGTMLLGVTAIVAITVLRPDDDNAGLYTTILGFLGATMVSSLSFIKAQQAVAVVATTAETLQTVHLSINSRFDTFASEIRAAAHAAGVKEAEDAQTATEVTALRATADAAAHAAEIDAAVALRVGTTQETATTVAKEVTAAVVEGMESVDVATIQPKAVSDIADAVRDEKS